MRNIIILGSEGFIGGRLIRYFLAEGFNVYGCDLFERPIRENYQYYKVSRLSPEWEEIFSKNKFDYCINAAGSGNVPYSMTHPLIDFEANTLDTIRVLDAIRRFNDTCHYLHISSAAVYGNPEILPVKEEATTRPLSPYGWHKLMAERICNEYHDIYKLPISIVRPFSVYGEGLRKQLLWDICTKLQHTDKIQLFGTGKESRDFIHVDDLVRLMHYVIKKSTFHCDIFNAASGIEYTIRIVSDVFERYYHSNKKIDFSGETRTGDPANWKADIKKIQSIGFYPEIDLKKGIEKYIEWYNRTLQ